MPNTRDTRPPTRFPGQGSYKGAAILDRWSTSYREDPQDRAERTIDSSAPNLRRYRDTYSSEDRPRRHDHPSTWQQRHEAQQRRVNRRKDDPGTYVPLSPSTDTAELAARLGVTL